MTRRRLAAAALVATVVFSGCTVRNVQFRTDDRLRITAPKSRAVVAAPLTLRWSMRDYDGAFVVFVDRAPMPAGKDLRWIARNDTSCALDPRCPDEKYLADRGVYVTRDTSLTLQSLPPASDGVGNEQHYVNVVLVDDDGRRIGESAWYRAFQSKRRST